ncbi:MAG TPA: hypothetical protein VIQ03_05140 [Gammaproteobacteria bacterium]
MSSLFSERPGVRERHLKRKYNNPLFGDTKISIDDIRLAQQQDAEEVAAFMTHFHELVKKAVALDSNAEADVILKLKEQLDKTYEQCSGLAGDQAEIKQMLKRLISAIMQAMWKGIGQDFQAQSKLEMEEKAREMHFKMLECQLVADLIRPDTLIDEDDLVPTLLSESAESVQSAMKLFVPEQQVVLCKIGHDLLATMDEQDIFYRQASERLREMEAGLPAQNVLPG